MTYFSKNAPLRFANLRFANLRFANLGSANFGRGSARSAETSLGAAGTSARATSFGHGSERNHGRPLAAYALLAASLSLTPLAAQNPLAAQKAPRLLLSASHLRRLERDRERQTERWINLGQRVAAAADSPERGFELALVYTVTHEEAAAEEAIRWAASHPLEYRQIALIADWCGDRLPGGDRTTILDAAWGRATKAP